jgi:hypothetical protein
MVGLRPFTLLYHERLIESTDYPGRHFPLCSRMSTRLYVDGTMDRLSAFARNATRVNTPRKIIRAHEEQGRQVPSNLGNPVHIISLLITLHHFTS